MEYRMLAGTGTKVSRFSLGTMTFGSQVNETEGIRMVHRALDAGINVIDTADAYNGGAAEMIVGNALEGRRDGVVLASKVRWRVGPSRPKDQGLSRWHIIHGVEASLKRLKTDCLDILFLHSPDYGTPLEESLSAADLLVRQGKIMYYGMSNYAAWQICRAKWLGEHHHYAQPAVTQVVYNLLTRSIEPELIPFCRESKVGVIAYNPLAGGLLTGKHDPAKPPVADSRFGINQEYFQRYWRDANFDAIADLSKIASEAGKTLTQLSFQWLAAQDAVDAIIIGASRLDQLDENLAAAEGSLVDDVRTACDQVWERIHGGSFQYNR